MLLVSTLPMIAEVQISTMHDIGYTIGYGIIALIGMYTAWHTRKVTKMSASIEDSVNHRHAKPEGTPRLYDAIIELHQHSHRMDEKTDELLEWKRTYDDGPLDTGSKAFKFVESVHELKEQVNKLEKHCKEGDYDGCDG